MNIRKTLASGVLALTLAGGVTACSGSSKAPDFPVASSSASVGIPVTPSAQNGSQGDSGASIDQAYLGAIHDQIPDTEGVPDSQLIHLGHLVCDDLDAGDDPISAATTIETNSGLSAYDSGFIVGASIAAYCSEYKNLVPSS